MQKTGIASLFGTAQRLAARGQAPLAAALYRDWLADNAGDPLAHAVWFNYGVVLSALNELAGAAQAFAEAIRLAPGFLPPYVNLGAVMERLGAPDRALGHWTHVTASLAGVTADHIAYKTTALKQAAALLELHKRLGEAEDALRQILELDPRPRDVLQHWVSLRQRQCAWPLLAPVGRFTVAELKRAMAPLSLANHADDPLFQLANAWAYCREDIGAPTQFRTDAEFRARPSAARLRIGYLSSDLRSHAIGHLMADMLRHHDRAAFEVFVYYNGIPQEDAVKARIRGQAEHWRSITELDDEAALARMLADGVDILVDVNGHTRGARTKLLSRRPAPVIVNWLGYPGTMGSPYHHYIVADEVIIPPGDERFYSERVLRLPCYQPNDRHRPEAAAAPTRAEAGLPEDATVFCSFNGTQKVTPFVFARWTEVLRRVPGSVLWLLKSCEEVDVRLRARAAEAGIAPERLVFAPMLGNAEHVARYALADLFLDSSPYGAHTTASDALWMGVPVVTFPGRSFASRVCASLVRAAGMPELVCDGPAAYVERAVALGQDRAAFTALRARLLAARTTSLLFDTPHFVAAMEALYREMWAAFEAGHLPRPDLRNLDACLEIGAAMDHDTEEFAAIPDYELRWRAALARRHAFSPLPPDARLWPGEA